MIKITKNSRHHLIRQIIETHRVGTQEELKALMEQKGVKVTQATLSRDLNTLQILKVPDPQKGYVYVVPERMGITPNIAVDRSPLQTCQRLDFSGNLAVLKCLPSYAPSVAMVLDGLSIEEILGTVAGDDTVLIVLKEGVTHERFKAALVARCPELTDLA